MTKKTLVSSLSLAAVALTLATVPASAVFATENTDSQTTAPATQPFAVEFTVQENSSNKYSELIIDLKGSLEKETSSYTSISYYIKDRTTGNYVQERRWLGSYPKGVPSLRLINTILIAYMPNGQYTFEFYGERGVYKDQLLATVDFDINRNQKVSETTEPKADVPTLDTPKVDDPKADVPTLDTPKVDDPKADVPTLDIPKVDEPKLDVPTVDTPKVDKPKTDSPKSETSQAASTVSKAEVKSAPAAKPATADVKQLPKTGEVMSILSLLGAGFLGLAGLSAKKRQ